MPERLLLELRLSAERIVGPAGVSIFRCCIFNHLQRVAGGAAKLPLVSCGNAIADCLAVLGLFDDAPRYQQLKLRASLK
jgi:hypothetical protein